MSELSFNLLIKLRHFKLPNLNFRTLNYRGFSLTQKQSTGFNEQTLDTIAGALSQQGYIVLPQALSGNLLQDLQQRIQKLAPEHWQQAGVGRNEKYQQDTGIRSDRIYWITAENPVEESFLDSMENLRQGLNRRLFMGLFDYESHFAIYPKGAYYQKHVDALQGQSNRVLSTVLYLNDDWQTDDAGELLLYPEQGDKPIERVLPQLGTLVIFLSEQFPHEVVTAHRQRFSLTGWFRVNASQSQRVDPAS